MKSINKKLIITLSFINVAMFGVFLLMDKTPFYFSEDYVVQFQTFILRMGTLWKSYFETGVFPFWDKSLFYGADTIGSMAYYGLGDIWTYFILLFGPSRISEAVVITHIIQLTLGSYFAYVFFVKNKVSTSTSFYLSLLYNASFWSVAIVGYLNQTRYLLYLPLFLIAADAMSEKKKYSGVWMSILLTVSLFNSVIYSFNFTVLVFLYLSIKRSFLLGRKSNLKDWLVWVKEWVVVNLFAVASSSLVIIPQLIHILDSSRQRAIWMANPFLYIGESLLNIISPQVSVLLGFRPFYGMQINSFASFIVVPLILYSLFNWREFKEKIEWRIAVSSMVIYVVILIIEPLNYMLNLLGGSYQRWTLIIVIFQLLIAGYAWDYLKTRPAHLKYIFYMTILVSSIGVISYFYFLPVSVNVFRNNRDQILVATFIASLVLLLPLINKNKHGLIILASLNLLFSYAILGVYSDNIAHPKQFVQPHPQASISSWMTNRGILYGGQAQHYFNSFISENMANRSMMLQYSFTTKEISQITGSLSVSLVQEYNPYMEYLLGVQYREKIRLTNNKNCYDQFFCLTPTHYPGPSGVILNHHKTISIDDFKAADTMNKYRYITSALLSEATTIQLLESERVNEDGFWVKEGEWFTYYPKDDATPHTFIAYNPAVFCVNKEDGVCDFETTSYYFDTDIVGLKTVSVFTGGSEPPYFIEHNRVEPYIEVHKKKEIKPMDSTTPYEWVDNNTISVDVKGLSEDEIVMLPVAYHKNFVITGGKGKLSEVQLGMLGISGTQGEETVLIEYRPTYLRYIAIAYFLEFIALFVLVISKKIRNLW